MDRGLLLTDDERGVAQIVGDGLRARGHVVVLVRTGGGAAETGQHTYTADLASPDGVAALLTLVRRRYGPIGGILHLLPLKGRATLEEVDFEGWRARLRLETKSLFYLARELTKDLEGVA